MFDVLYKIKYFEKDPQGRLKFNVLLDFMSDIATLNADFRNFGYNFISEKNYAWFLLKYAIKFTKYPQNISEINMKTRSRGANKLFAYRDFFLYDDSDTLLGNAFSVWGLIDLKSRKMLNINEVLGENMPVFQKDENDLIFTKIPQISNVTFEKQFEANYYDIDINHHVNNTCLMRWALEALPVDFLTQHTISDVQIVFKNETKLHDKIIAQVELNNNVTIHSLKNAITNEDLALFMFTWN